MTCQNVSKINLPKTSYLASEWMLKQIQDLLEEDEVSKVTPNQLKIMKPEDNQVQKVK